MTGRNRTHEEFPPADSFRPAVGLGNAFRQTVAGALLPARYPAALPPPDRQEIQVGPRESLSVLVTRAARSPQGRLVLLHGLGGSAGSRYMVRTTEAAWRRGWEVARVNFRGAEPNRPPGPTFHNAQRSDDVDAVLQGIRWPGSGEMRIGSDCRGLRTGADGRRLRTGSDAGCGAGSHAEARSGRADRDEFARSGCDVEVGADPAGGVRCGGLPLVAAGLSLGGAILLRHLATAGRRSPLAAAVAVSPPIDLGRCLAELELPRNWLYHRFYVSRLRRQAERKLAAFPGLLPSRPPRLDSIRKIDEHYVAPDAGYPSAEAYYSGASVLPLLGAVTTPALILSSEDDPFIPPSLFANLDSPARALRTVMTPAGGHVGYLAGGPVRGFSFWAADALLDWLERVTEP